MIHVYEGIPTLGCERSIHGRQTDALAGRWYFVAAHAVRCACRRRGTHRKADGENEEWRNLYELEISSHTYHFERT